MTVATYFSDVPHFSYYSIIFLLLKSLKQKITQAKLFLEVNAQFGFLQTVL